MNAKDKVWSSAFPHKTQNMQSINWRASCSDRDQLELSRIYHYRTDCVPKELVPDYLYFNVSDKPEKAKSNLPDAFKVSSGLQVIAERFRNLLLDFDMGQNQFFELPLYEYDEKSQRPDKLYQLRVCTVKDSFMPEQTAELERAMRRATEKSRWAPYNFDTVLALSQSRLANAGSADLWQEEWVEAHFFLSDRLRQAIKSEKIRATVWGFKPCKLVA